MLQLLIPWSNLSKLLISINSRKRQLGFPWAYLFLKKKKKHTRGAVRIGLGAEAGWESYSNVSSLPHITW